MKKILTALAALALFTGAPLAAQSCVTNGTATAGASTAICNVSTTASVTVHDVMRLTLDATTTDLGTPVEADFDAGFKNTSGPSITVRSNRGWVVTVVSDQENFGYAGAQTNPSKPRTDLKWGTVSGTYGNNMGTSAQLAAGSATSSVSASIFYQTLYSWTATPPGVYSLPVKFTLSTP